MRGLFVATLASFVIAIPRVAPAQTTTYYLHKEASLINSANKQLKTASPEAAQTAFQTANLKGSVGTNFAALVANFETQSGVPGTAGTIQAGSMVTFKLYMKTTSLPSMGNM